MATDKQDDVSSEEEEEEKEEKPVEDLPKKPPRRPRTAYTFFIQQNFGPTAKKTGLRSPRDVLKRLGGMWKEMTDEAKEPYRDMYVAERERYAKEKQAWNKAFGGRPPKMRQRKKPKGGPKRTRNAFIQFEKSVWKEVRGEHPELTQREIVQEIAKRWRDLSPDQKKPFEEQAEQDKIRYAEEKEAFKKRSAEGRLKKLEAEKRLQASSSILPPLNQNEAPVQRKALVPAAAVPPPVLVNEPPPPPAAAPANEPAPAPDGQVADEPAAIEAPVPAAEGVPAQPPAPANPEPGEGQPIQGA